MIRRKYIFIMVIGLVLMIVLCLGYQYLYAEPYDQFQLDVDEVRPVFDRLNDSILEQIPPPDGVTVKESGHGTGGSRYGPNLYVIYKTRVGTVK
jgi:hypothetical protein